YGYLAVLLGVLVTSFYSFRLLYMTFHGRERFRDVVPSHDHHAEAGHGEHAQDPAHGDDPAHHGPVEPHESPWVVTLPLVLLAIPSIAIGFFTIGPMLFGGFFADSIFVRTANDSLAGVAAHFHGALDFGLHFWASPAFWMAFAGFALATLFYLWRPELPARV